VISRLTRNSRIHGYDGRHRRTDEEWARHPWPRSFVAYVVWQGWCEISLGLHVCLVDPNIEVHLPFFFVRLGWQR
jgi:hypothetical protein